MCINGYFQNRDYHCLLDNTICPYKNACEKLCECPAWEDHIQYIRMIT